MEREQQKVRLKILVIVFRLDLVKDFPMRLAALLDFGLIIVCLAALMIMEMVLMIILLVILREIL